MMKCNYCHHLVSSMYSAKGFLVSQIIKYLSMWLIIVNLNPCKCFNVDTEYPITFSPSNKSSFQVSTDHFGYSVAVKSVSGGEPRFIIGAPKASTNIYKVNQTGTIYLCKLSGNNREETNCNEINVIQDSRPFSQDFQFFQHEPTSNMFLGGSLSSASGNSEEVAACGHLWSREIDINSTQFGRYHTLNPSGSCYLFDVKQTGIASKKAVYPLTTFNKQVFHQTYYYSQAVSGFSVTHSKASQQLLLGAPGFYQWRGGVVAYNSNDFKGRFLTEAVQFDERVATDAYFGYSIATGRFYRRNVEYVAAGAPRDMFYRGSVYIFAPTMLAGDNLLRDPRVFHGSHFGEYFGASLLAVDINNDGLSDLIVGSPLYTPSIQSVGDRGRVYVYVANGISFNEPQILTGANKPSARFGFALCDLGDINSDGYNDIAVGAPYEDENSGSVYIYTGSHTGIKEDFTQRISASESLKFLNLKGFGSSLIAADVDNNRYPDIIAGAYLSDKVVLLRSHPVADLKAELSFTNKVIVSRNCHQISCSSVEFCFRLQGRHLRQTEKVKLKLDIDTKYKRQGADLLRAYMVVNSRKFISYETTRTLPRNSRLCFAPIPIFLVENIVDKMTPIQFELTYGFLNDHQTGFCTNCPVSSDSKKSISSELFFETGCGTDRKCVSNLNLNTWVSVESRNLTSLVQGQYNDILLNILVNNSGENAHSARIVVTVTPPIPLIRLQKHCDIVEDLDTYLTIECTLGNPFESGLSSVLQMPFDVSKLGRDVQNLTFTANISTISELSPNSRSNSTFVLPILRYANIKLFTNEDNLMFYENWRRRKSDHQLFSVGFQIHKSNYSEVKEVNATLWLPAFNKAGRPVLFQPFIENLGSVGINCDYHIKDLPVIPEMVDEVDGVTFNTSSVFPEISRLQAKSQTRVKRDTAETASLSRYNTLTTREEPTQLDCQSLKCEPVECKVGPFKRGHQVAAFNLHSAINITLVEFTFGGSKSSYELVINLDAQISDSDVILVDEKSSVEQNVNLTDQTDQSQIKSIALRVRFYKLMYRARIKIWVLILSVTCGLFILSLLLVAFTQCGFFRRKKREEMQQLLHQAALKRNFGLDSGILELKTDVTSLTDDSSVDTFKQSRVNLVT